MTKLPLPPRRPMIKPAEKLPRLKPPDRPKSAKKLATKALPKPSEKRNKGLMVRLDPGLMGRLERYAQSQGLLSVQSAIRTILDGELPR